MPADLENFVLKIEDLKFNLDELGYAVITQACNDYFMSKRALMDGKNSHLNINNCKKMIKKCEDFFVSKEFELYSGYSNRAKGRDLIDKINRDAEDRETYPKNIAIYGSSNKVDSMV